MAKRKNTTNPYEKAYNKELRRIQRFLKGANKRGYIWFDNPVPNRPKKITQASVNRLKKLTPDVLYQKGEYIDESTGELLSGRTGRKIERKRATEKAKATREAKKNKGKQKPKKQTKQEQPKPTPEVQTDPTPVAPPELPDEVYDTEPEAPQGEVYYPDFTHVVLSNFLATLKQFPNAEGVAILAQWYDRLIADNGREAVAQMLQEGAENGLIISWETVYKSTATKTYMTEMMDYLPDQGEIYKDQILDMMEEIEWWEMPE